MGGLKKRKIIYKVFFSSVDNKSL